MQHAHIATCPLLYLLPHLAKKNPTHNVAGFFPRYETEEAYFENRFCNDLIGSTRGAGLQLFCNWTFKFWLELKDRSSHIRVKFLPRFCIPAGACQAAVLSGGKFSI